MMKKGASKTPADRPELWIVKDILDVYNLLEPHEWSGNTPPCAEDRTRLERRLAALQQELGREITAMQAVDMLWLQ